MSSNANDTGGDVDSGADEDAACSAYEDDCRVMALHALSQKTGYTIMQENGQRMYGGPPPGWEGPPPPRGCEVFVGKIPRDMFEDDLVPLFERAGRIYEVRLMMEFSGENRGYAFVMYTSRESAQKAIQMLDNFEVRPGKFIGVCVSLDNCRLFIGSIPKDKSREAILEEMEKVTDDVSDVIVYPSSMDENKNRGFAFVEYKSHKAAALARRKLIQATFRLWGQRIQVNWAEPERDEEDEVMQHVRVLYVRNLMPQTSEDTLHREFSRFKPGSVERIKKLSDYAFVHYRCRGDALTALHLMNGMQIDGATVEVRLAKPAGIKDSVSSGRRRGSTGGNLETYQSEDRLRQADWSPSVRPTPLAIALGNPFYLTGGVSRVECESLFLPLLPGMPLTPSSLLFLKQSQICSAVALLDWYCTKRCWAPPEYHLFSSPGQDGALLLLYKVVLPSTQSTFMPNKLCSFLDTAKELAAQTALWNLDPSLLSSVSHELSSSPPPPLSMPPSPCNSPGLMSTGGRGFSATLTPPPPTQGQSVYFSSSLLFY